MINMYFFPYNGKIHLTTVAKCVVGDYLRVECEWHGSKEKQIISTPEGSVLFKGYLSKDEMKQLVMEYFGISSSEFVITFPAR